VILDDGHVFDADTPHGRFAVVAFEGFNVNEVEVELSRDRLAKTMKHPEAKEINVMEFVPLIYDLC